MSERTTTTAESLLGILSLRPMSGYEIRQVMDRSTSNFWRESYGQIYPALKKLVAQGLAEMEESHPVGQRLSKVYRLTPAGRERLLEWLSLPTEPQVKRNELLLKIFFGAQTGPEVVRKHLEDWRGRMAESLARYGEIESGLTQLHDGHPGLPFFLMTVRYGIAEARALIAWCDESLMALQEQK